MKFRDRAQAGAELADRIVQEKGPGPAIVLGIPRGGVILADIVAKALDADFDIVIPRKLGAPENEELAIGAVTQDGTSYLNRYLVDALKVSAEYLEHEKQKQVAEIVRRSSAYRRSGEPAKIAGRLAILVDDGIATGATVIASARWVRKQKPARLVVAVPVAPRQSVEILKDECDSVITLYAPAEFGSVGQFYEKFEPVSDEQVQSIMRARKLL